MKYPEYIVDMYKDYDELSAELDELIGLGFDNDSAEVVSIYKQLAMLEDEIQEECSTYLTEIGEPVDVYLDMNLWMEDLEAQVE